MTDKPLTEKDFELFGLNETFIYPKVQSAKRLLKQKISGEIDSQFYCSIIDACFQIPDGIDGLPERCPSCGTPTKIKDYCTNCAFDNQEAAKGVMEKGTTCNRTSKPQPLRKSLKPIGKVGLELLRG